MFEESMQKTAETRESLQRGSTHRVSLQTRAGKTLIGVPITGDSTAVAPKVVRAPVRAVLCATRLVARIVGLKILIE